jgi:hypothetical protein
MVDKEEQRTSFGSLSRLEKMERHVVVADPRRESAYDLVRMDIPPSHATAIAKEGLPRGLYDNRNRPWPLGCPLQFGGKSVSFPGERREEIVAGLAFDRELWMVGVRFRVVSTVSRDGVISGRERHVARVDCTLVERPRVLFARVS